MPSHLTPPLLGLRRDDTSEFTHLRIRQMSVPQRLLHQRQLLQGLRDPQPFRCCDRREPALPRQPVLHRHTPPRPPRLPAVVLHQHIQESGQATRLPRRMGDELGLQLFGRDITQFHHPIMTKGCDTDHPTPDRFPAGNHHRRRHPGERAPGTDGRARATRCASRRTPPAHRTTCGTDVRARPPRCSLGAPEDHVAALAHHHATAVCDRGCELGAHLASPLVGTCHVSGAEGVVVGR